MIPVYRNESNLYTASQALSIASKQMHDGLARSLTTDVVESMFVVKGSTYYGYYPQNVC